ncbi:hypothetical protein DFJ73DRAFT_899281 [Zopfochytrium polystomum]|nr:hypothetical protein DFJ73DRAFT_899281 [Zopfochytrium polystomum]
MGDGPGGKTTPRDLALQEQQEHRQHDDAPQQPASNDDDGDGDGGDDDVKGAAQQQQAQQEEEEPPPGGGGGDTRKVAPDDREKKPPWRTHNPNGLIPFSPLTGDAVAAAHAPLPVYLAPPLLPPSPPPRDPAAAASDLNDAAGPIELAAAAPTSAFARYAKPIKAAAQPPPPPPAAATERELAACALSHPPPEPPPPPDDDEFTYPVEADSDAAAAAAVAAAKPADRARTPRQRTLLAAVVAAAALLVAAAAIAAGVAVAVARSRSDDHPIRFATPSPPSPPSPLPREVAVPPAFRLRWVNSSNCVGTTRTSGGNASFWYLVGPSCDAASGLLFNSTGGCWRNVASGFCLTVRNDTIPYLANCSSSRLDQQLRLYGVTVVDGNGACMATAWVTPASTTYVAECGNYTVDAVAAGPAAGGNVGGAGGDLQIVN